MHRVARSVLTRKSWQASLSILGISLGLSLFSVAYKRALDPLFGSIPTEKYLDRVVHTCTVLGVLFPKPTIGQTLLYLATLVQFASHSTYWVSVFAARYGDPIAGPLAPHTLVLAPIVFLSVSLMMRINHRIGLATLVANILRLRWAMTTIPQKVFLVMRSDHVFLLLGTLTFAIWTLVNGNAKPTSGMQDGGKILRRLKAYSPLFIPATFLLFPVLRSPVLSANSMFPYHSDKYPLRILSSEESLTGRIVVGELLDVPQDGTSDALHSLRYLRASHSLLGGVWTADRVATIGNAPPQTDGFGTPIGDSIYSAFVLQEAVRLVNGTPQCRDDHCGNALVIGVGAGIVADALARHGVSTTLIEIDPAVYTAARKYFGLKHPGDDKVFLEDARGWLRGYSGNQLAFPTSKFDIVVHDCFSGGGLPKHLFSIEFWDELKTVMTPNGVVAINFAGGPGSKSSRAVVTTLLEAFGQCRAFHDLLNPTSDDRHDEFINIVFFCSISRTPLTFRPSVEDDYLHSHLRYHVLSSLERREVPVDAIMGPHVWSKDAEEMYLLTDVNNKLDEWQRAEALEHWKVMRKVLPDIVWETY